MHYLCFDHSLYQGNKDVMHYATTSGRIVYSLCQLFQYVFTADTVIVSTECYISPILFQLMTGNIVVHVLFTTLTKYWIWEGLIK